MQRRNDGDAVGGQHLCVNLVPAMPCARREGGRVSASGAAFAAMSITIIVALIWRWIRRGDGARAIDPIGPPEMPRITDRPRSRARTGRLGGGAGLALTATSMACPSCRHEYEGAVYCTRDARRLVAAHELQTRNQGVTCMACGRAFDPGIRRCPHDGSALVPFAVYVATRTRTRMLEPAGVIARICPVCGSRFDLHARFCAIDGAELVVIN